MPTVKTVEYKGPCKCGAGSVTIDFCSPDDGGPTATPWYEIHFRCDECSKRFVVLRQGMDFIWASKHELGGRRAVKNQAAAQAQQLLSSKPVALIKSALLKLLNAQSSVAATYGMLKNAGLESNSMGTFRKRWSTPSAWVDSNVNIVSLPKVMVLLEIEDKGVSSKLSEIAMLEIIAKQPLRPVGDAIHKLDAPLGKARLGQAG